MEKRIPIIRNIKTLDRLVEDVKEISMIKTKSLSLEIKKVNLKKIVEETVESIGPIAWKKNVKIVQHIGPHLSVQADPIRVAQVVYNIINNALKFTLSGGTITISAEKKKNEVLFKINDTGVGIAKKDLTKLFEPFSKIEIVTLKESRGTGLGLSICKGIVEQHGGKIWVESALKKGSTFYFTLPLIFKK